MKPLKVAIVGSGNIGTDLMYKIRASKRLELVAMAGIDPESDGLQRASKLGVAVTHEGVEGLIRLPEFESVRLVFDSSSAKAHASNYEAVAARGRRVIDLTPAALGPFMVPVVNFDSLRQEPNINMVSCGGQATIPIVAAVSRIARVHYAEIVCSLASVSAGPGTRANIDEFTQTTARALESVGGAAQAKAIIILNPAEPPLLMRNTVFVLSEETDDGRVRDSIGKMIAAVREYVPGYRLKQEVQFEQFGARRPLHIPGRGDFQGLKTSVYLEIEGAGHYLPKFAGNLDIMTSSALATGERISKVQLETSLAPVPA